MTVAITRLSLYGGIAPVLGEVSPPAAAPARVLVGGYTPSRSRADREREDEAWETAHGRAPKREQTPATPTAEPEILATAAPPKIDETGRVAVLELPLPPLDEIELDDEEQLPVWLGILFDD